MFVLKPMELVVVLPVLALALAYCFARGVSFKRLAVYALAILASSVVLWNLVESHH